MSRKKIDMSGQTRGRWQVLEYAGRDKNRHDLWKCRCSCPLGTERVVRGSFLRNEESLSCGCLARELSSERKTTHGLSKTRIHRIWSQMLVRTGIHKGASEQERRSYIDRGITVCDEWLIFENFRDWALANGYSDDLELDRIDNDQGYSPENCQWVSHRANQNNRRNTLRLEDGTPLAMFCTEVGIATRENGKKTKQYLRIVTMYRKRHKAHPEILQAANNTIALYSKTLALLKLRDDVRHFAAEVALISKNEAKHPSLI